MLTKTKWILAGGAAAVALSPVAAFASGYEGPSGAAPDAIESVQSGSLVADAVSGVTPAFDPTAAPTDAPSATAATPNTPATSQTANTPRTPQTAHTPNTPASPVTAKSPVTPNTPNTPASPASA